MAASPTFHNPPRDKQQRIPGQTPREFADKGRAYASINPLKSGLGKSKGSSFKFFTDKAGLFSEVFFNSTREAKRRLAEARDRAAGRVGARLFELPRRGMGARP